LLLTCAAGRCWIILIMKKFVYHFGDYNKSRLPNLFGCCNKVWILTDLVIVTSPKTWKNKGMHGVAQLCRSNWLGLSWIWICYQKKLQIIEIRAFTRNILTGYPLYIPNIYCKISSSIKDAAKDPGYRGVVASRRTDEARRANLERKFLPPLPHGAIDALLKEHWQTTNMHIVVIMSQMDIEIQENGLIWLPKMEP
jgi:hypothetical protein